MTPWNPTLAMSDPEEKIRDKTWTTVHVSDSPSFGRAKALSEIPEISWWETIFLLG